MVQAMHRNQTRRIRHPLGVTDWFEPGRGAAQGAVESPWFYSHFIDGLAKALKKAGLGVVIAGQRVALVLMYADKIVMFAASLPELERMNAIATKYAYMHRFQFNGEKSGIQLFNATAAERKRASEHQWTLGGEEVKVTGKYTYLGTTTTNDEGNWSTHVKEAIKKAQRKSADLLWVCRSDKGMRPRTAIALWNALVRPILEYASELWMGQAPAYVLEAAEKVQTTFLKGTMGLHENGSGVSNAVLRAEAGCEPLKDR